jgi:hypothetical protein
MTTTENTPTVADLRADAKATIQTSTAGRLVSLGTLGTAVGLAVSTAVLPRPMAITAAGLGVTVLVTFLAGAAAYIYALPWLVVAINDSPQSEENTA